LGLALDEPRDGDTTFEVDGLTFLMAENEERLLGNGRDVRVDYFEDGFGRGFHVSTTLSSSCDLPY
jgi:hypothetical protein